MTMTFSYEFARARVFFVFCLFMFITIKGSGQGCPTINLSSSSGESCGLTPVTISGNSFGGSATRVTIKENGRGSVSPTSASATPFTFTYTPRENDLGKNVIITVTTNDPAGGQCDEEVAIYTLRITSSLSAPVVGTITNPICSSTTGQVELRGLPSNGTWTLIRSPGDETTTGTGTSTIISGLAAGTYTYSVSNTTGCTSGPSTGVVITSQPGAVTLAITNPQAVCSPSKADLTSAAVTAGSTPGLTFSYWTNAGATTAYATPSSADEGTYYIKGTLGTQCFDVKPVIVTISTLAVANAGLGGHICALDFKLNASLTTGTGTWTKISGPGNIVFTPDNHQPDANVNVDRAGVYDFAWTVGNISCASSDIIRVIFHEVPSLYISPGIETTICKGANFQLHADGTGFFSWTPAELFSNPNISDPVATPLATTTLTVTVTDQYGCKNSADINVNLIDKPVADAGPDQLLESLDGTTMNAVLYNDYDKGVWSLISGSGDLSDPAFEKTSLSGLTENKNSFMWTVTNGYCQASYDTVMIMVRDMIIPTLITPNMDGRNDYFIIGGAGAKGKVELVIFDRRGAQVYKNLNYDNLWDGVDYNDNPLPEDTYFYVLKAGNSQSSTGYIVIRR